MSDFDTVSGHLDVDAVLDASSAHAVGIHRAWGRGPGGHKYRFNTGCIKGRRVVQKLTGAHEFWRSCNPVCVGLGNHYATVV